MSLANIISVIGESYIDWKNVYYIISSVLSAMLAYKTLYWIIGFFFTRKFKPAKNKHKYGIVIAARNEEKVIGNLLDSINKQDYPKELYDIFVIADNCTDNTAKVAKESGAIVYERFDENHKTKGYALQWFFNKKIEEDAPYDAFCIFDADNIVDKNFLKVMNKKLCQGEDVVQGYKDIKNPSDSWVSAGYAIFYWTMHRFYHLARYNIGLSPLMNGTGFMVKFDVIKPHGWDTKTLTEDIEFSLKRIIKGKKLGWATDAICYDEQPVGFVQSWSQRSRWTVGHIQCIHEYTKKLAIAAKENKTMMNFDGLLYIVGSIPMFILTLLLLATNFLMYAGDGMTQAELMMNMLRYLVPTFLLPIATGVIAMYLDKRPIKPMLKGLACYPLFMGSWLLINFKCLFKRETTWEKINHVRNIKIADDGLQEGLQEERN